MVTIVVIVAAAAIIAGITTELYLMSTANHTGTSNSSGALPAGCTKPSGGFLIVASHLGWNESILHGAPDATWPKISVKQGTTVNITVCNTDVQTHSFQIAHYEQGASNTIQPGRVQHFTFVADETGTFQIYCQVLCSIHIYMQSGQLVVTS